MVRPGRAHEPLGGSGPYAPVPEVTSNDPGRVRAVIRAHTSQLRRD